MRYRQPPSKIELPVFQPLASSCFQRRDSNLTTQTHSQSRTKSPQKKLYNSCVQPTEHYRSMSVKQWSTYEGQVPLKHPIMQMQDNSDPTVFFQYPPVCEQVRPLINARPLTKEEVEQYDLKFKILGSNPYKCVLTAFEYAGFQNCDEDELWNVQWGQGSQQTLKNMNRYQKINHFPGCWNMGRKDLLWLNLSKFKRKFPKDFAFVPNTYILAYDFDRFINAQEAATNNMLWIKKPCAESRGRGISMINKRTKVKKSKNFLIMDYIANPHTINGFKYDLRVYVLISSFDPLRVYMYKDGLVRFATSKYTTSSKDLGKKYVHLTNFSVNKHSPNFVKNQQADRDDEGSKWSHVALRKKYQEMGIDPKQVFKSIKDVILKTCIASEPFMLDTNAKSSEHRNGYFELYGFDVLIDERLKPWVLEVNVSPSLNSSAPIDRRIKTSLISDVLHLVGIPLWNKSDLVSQSPQRYSYQRNLKDIQSINVQNCQQRLGQQDIQQIHITMEERRRAKPNFSCIYPNQKTLNYYSNFFEFPRYNNRLIEKFYQERCSWLTRL